MNLQESDSDSSSNLDECAEKYPKGDVKQKTDARDEWMSMPGLFPCVVKEKKKPVKKEDSEKMILDAVIEIIYQNAVLSTICPCYLHFPRHR